MKELLEIFKLDFVSSSTAINAKFNHNYKIDGNLIMPKLNNYHTKLNPFIYFNKLLINSLRENLKINNNPTSYLFLSRKGIRRHILSESTLFDNLKKIHNFNYINPGEFSVKDQQLYFQNANVIVSPHGACLTNMVFCNWEKVTLIEISGKSYPATFKIDLQIPRHYVILVNNDSNLNLLFDPNKMTEIISQILQNENLEKYKFNGSNPFNLDNMLECD
jgi:hypothetical protein